MGTTCRGPDSDVLSSVSVVIHRIVISLSYSTVADSARLLPRSLAIGVNLVHDSLQPIVCRVLVFFCRGRGDEPACGAVVQKPHNSLTGCLHGVLLSLDVHVNS